ncbi:hypothetical protein PMI01_00127 [Caulobacter sp. AP07]|uniref:hypothetical protein n=1 Tax=Caulobacter sp. AP07 TaxID=1144304 RepID=UPI000271F212|nr:hypothetical protein [Caulobacter sp. AP07]EJL38367.1 hypothetical protein PMI01_00127 [Caulobacter sp. AP07]
MSEGKADPTAVSRRVLIGAPVLAGAAGRSRADDVVARSAAFLAVDAEIGRLSGRWGDLEALAIGRHAWFLHAGRRRLTVPEGREMARIDAVLETLFERRVELLDGLCAAPAVDPGAAAAKLAVAARVICADTDERLHRLLDGLARDLAAMRCPHCRAPLVSGTPGP